ncbi:potassium channel family protein [Sphingomonas immobilis]|uniref:Potassium channel protein n=1 Tax=Sphingomonas immobilis TaxID=3063997 RepID=A0ABT8ZZC1_9SPHN|nr:potassium channel protein [Sphingomonas sp. CA1-15]MDO7842464.1 potassium channel protein [Sphingomonas sp. CA1-15]
MRTFLNDAENALGSPVRNLVSIVALVLTVVVVATLAYMAAGWTFREAIYMVLLTVYTVGYGEVRPIDTPYLEGVTIGLMVFGCTGMILFTGALVQFFTVLQLKQILGANRMQSRIEKLTGHVVVCGYGRIGVMLAHDLAAGGVPLVVVERGAARLAEAEAAGHLCVTGDATEEEVLIAAGILRARTLATVLPDDAANVFITLSARNLAPDLEIIARGEAPTTERKLLRAGANQVVQPTHIGAERMARMILFPASATLEGDARMTQVRGDLGELGLDLELVPVLAGSAMARLTVGEAERQGAGAFFIVQIRRADTAISRPAKDEPLQPDDTVLVLVRDSGNAARRLFNSKEQLRTGRNVF